MSGRCGILLAGGEGTRLYPITRVVNKQLLPIYSKPMIYYPLSALMLAGIRDIVVITNPEDRAPFARALGDGSDWGVRLSYAVQPRPSGIADALRLGERFLDGRPSALILGDNLFYGAELQRRLRETANREHGATVFAYPVSDPERYAVVEVDAQWRPLSIEEKPARPRSRYAVPGLYFLDGRAPELARRAAPSARGELEITSVLQAYLDEGALRVESLGRGSAWLDAGTFESLQQAASFVEAIEKRQGLMIGCPEEVAWRLGWISDEALAALARGLERSPYGRYLAGLAEGSGGPAPPVGAGGGGALRW